MMVGVGVGVSDDGNRSGYGPDLLVSGTFEMGVANAARIRVETARTRQPLPPGGAPTPNESDTAHISRLTISLAVLGRSLTPLMPYGGAGIGVYHATFDRSPPTSWRPGAYFHAGIEVQPAHALAIDGEVGLHVVPRTLYPEGALFGELVARLKVKF